MSASRRLESLRLQRARLLDDLGQLPARCKGCTKRRQSIARHLASLDELMRELADALISRRWP